MRRYLLIGLPIGLLLASCAADGPQGPRPAPYQPTHIDSTLDVAGLPSVGKLVIRGPVTFQVAGPHSTQTASATDNRKAGQKQGAAATAPGAKVEQASERGGGGQSYWWLVGAALAGAVGWELLSRKAAVLKWLPWRARVG